jgi:predicted dehydrogenase
MGDRKVKVGIIGLGHNGYAHARCHRNLPQSDLVALCDRNQQRLEQAGRELGVSQLYTGDEIFQDPEIEAISINTGDSFHRDPFLKAVAAGKHVLVEKPLANSVLDVLDMVRAASQAPPGLKILVGYILRFDPIFEHIHQLARTRAFGDIFYLEADYVHNLLYQKAQIDPVTGRNWYLEHELPMVGGGSHALDLLRWFKGRPVTQVWSCSNHIAFPEMAHDDCMVSLFKFDDGTIAKVAALYGPRCEMPPFYNLRVYGTRGTVERDQVALAASLQDVHPPFKPVPAERRQGHPFDPEIADWLDAILDDRPVRTGLLDGASSTLATLLAVQSVKEGKEINVPRLDARGS